jgi:hypothetical protein
VEVQVVEVVEVAVAAAARHLQLVVEPLEEDLLGR